jgi:filamentous hemagglutinin
LPGSIYSSSNDVGRVAATDRLVTGADGAVFLSGIGRDGDATAASWAAKHGGVTLDSALAQGGIRWPAWDASDPSVVSAWRRASADFASRASGNVRVLQGVDVRVGSVWAEVEYPALISNPNVTSITSINPATGEQVVLWTRP